MRCALSINQAPGRQIERTNRVGRVRDQPTQRVIAKRQLPNLPGIAWRLFAGEDNVFSVEGNIGVRCRSKSRHELFSLSGMNEQQLSACGKPLFTAQSSERLVDPRSSDDEVRIRRSRRVRCKPTNQKQHCNGRGERQKPKGCPHPITSMASFPVSRCSSSKLRNSIHGLSAAIIASNSAKLSDCSPSLHAFSGLGCPPTKSPSAPAATAMRASAGTSWLRPAAWLGSAITGR